MRPTHPGILIWLLVLALAWPASAHKIQRSGDVVGTWHLEPKHSPRAGEPARVWIALTQARGKAIPLEQCDCQLMVYNLNQPEAGTILTPTLQALSTEAFQDIPAADLTFPRVGEYRLVLTGKPKVSGDFAPFQLSYTTVVGVSPRAVTIAPPPEGQPAWPKAFRRTWVIAAGVAIALLGLGLGRHR